MLARKSFAVLLLLPLAAACDDANCFAGECETGPTGVVSGPPEPRDLFFELALESGTLYRIERDTVPVALHGAVTGTDRREVRQVLDEVEVLTGVAFRMTDGETWFNLHFRTPADMEESTGLDPTGAAGKCWWSGVPELGLREATMWVSDTYRDSTRVIIMRHEVAHCIGLSGHASQEVTSILYVGSERRRASPDTLSSVDQFVLETLYHPALRSGMDEAAVRAALGW